MALIALPIISAAGLKEVAANPVMRVLVVMYGVNSFGNGTTLLLFTLTLSLSVTEGGLGMEPIGIGIAFSVFGAAALAFQVAFFRRILHRLGVRRVHRYVGSLCLAGGVILLPASSRASSAAASPPLLAARAVTLPVACAAQFRWAGIPTPPRPAWRRRGRAATCASPSAPPAS